jgi:hypothetical protein
MSEQTLFWLFSTIAQTFGAILGVVGMVAIYRFQDIRRLRWDVMAWCESERHSRFGEHVHMQAAEGFISAWRREKKTLNVEAEKGQRNFEKLNAAEDKLVELFRTHERIRWKFISFVMFKLLTILAALALLPFCKDTLFIESFIDTLGLLVITSLVLAGWLGVSLIPSGKLDISES